MTRRWPYILIVLVAGVGAWLLVRGPGRPESPAAAAWLYVTREAPRDGADGPDWYGVVRRDGTVLLAPEPARVSLLRLPTSRERERAMRLERLLKHPDADPEATDQVLWIWRNFQARPDWTTQTRWPYVVKQERRRQQLLDAAGRVWYEGDSQNMTIIRWPYLLLEGQVHVVETAGPRPLGVAMDGETANTLRGELFMDALEVTELPSGRLLLGHQVYDETGELLLERAYPEWLWGDYFAFVAPDLQQERLSDRNLLRADRGIVNAADGQLLLPPEQVIQHLVGPLVLLDPEASDPTLLSLRSGKQLDLDFGPGGQAFQRWKSTTRLVIGETRVAVVDDTAARIYDLDLGLLATLGPDEAEWAAQFEGQRTFRPIGNTEPSVVTTTKSGRVPDGEGPDGETRYRKVKTRTTRLGNSELEGEYRDIQIGGHPGELDRFIVWTMDERLGLTDGRGRWLVQPRAVPDLEQVVDVAYGESATGEPEMVVFYMDPAGGLRVGGDGPVLQDQPFAKQLVDGSDDWRADARTSEDPPFIERVCGPWVVLRLHVNASSTPSRLYMTYNRESRSWYPHVATELDSKQTTAIGLSRLRDGTIAYLDPDGRVIWQRPGLVPWQYELEAAP